MNLSVIIPVYNGEETILNALDSAFCQDYLSEENRIEVIVVNDGSSDNTLSIVESYKEEHKLDNLKVYTTINGGVAKARNLGIKKSNYNWIAFLDADDTWSKNKISLQVSYINSIQPEPNLIGSARNNEVLSLLGRRITTLHKASINQLLIKVFPQTSTAIVKKEALLNCGLYDENMTHSEDADLWVRLCAKEGDFYYHPESTVITGAGKHNFGATGLSANMREMERGSCLMLYKTYKRKDIQLMTFLSFLVFYKFKYLRRLLIAFIRSNRAV